MSPQSRSALSLGFAPTNPIGFMATLALSAVNTQLAMSFVCEQAKTLASVAIYCSASNGTLGNVAVTANLCADAAGVPNAGTIIETVTIAAGAWPGANNWATFSGFSSALTANTRYWVIFKNISAVPTTDYPTLRFSSADTVAHQSMGRGNPKWGWSKLGTTDGTTFTTAPVHPVAGLFIGFSDGTYDGLAFENIANIGVGSTAGVYAARESGVVVVTPAHGFLSAVGVAMPFTYTGTPTQAAKFGMRINGGAAKYTGRFPLANVQINAQWMTGYFDSPVIIPPSSQVRITLAEDSQSDASTNFYKLIQYTFKDDVNALTKLPFAGSCKWTYSTDGTVFTDTANIITPFAVLLDDTNPFASAPLNRRKYHNQR